MRTLMVLLLTMFLTTGIFGQTKSGGLVVINEKGIILLEGCPSEKDSQLVLLDESGNLISSSSFEGDIIELNFSELNEVRSLTVISGDCKVTRKIKR